MDVFAMRKVANSLDVRSEHFLSEIVKYENVRADKSFVSFVFFLHHVHNMNTSRYSCLSSCYFS
jgi:hypothetical protein